MIFISKVKYFLIVLILTNIILFIFRPNKYYSTIDFSNKTNIVNGSVEYDIDLPGCRILTNLKDSSILRFVSEESYVPHKCEGKPALTYLRRGILGINVSILKSYYPKTIVKYCDYRVVFRNIISKHPDNTLVYSLPIIFYPQTHPLPIGSVHIITVRCFNTAGKHFYQYVHANPFQNHVSKSPLLRNGPKSFGAKKNHFRPNILILGIGSTSGSNFLRGLTRTRAYIEGRRPGSTYIFERHVKVGHGSSSNLIPLLTGKHANLYKGSLGFVFKRYRALGYSILLAEDSSPTSSFGSRGAGFRNSPADFYFRPFILEWDRISKGEACLHGRHQTDVMLEYTSDLLNSLGDTPYFAFTLATQLTRNNTNGIYDIDHLILLFFKKLYEAKKLDNTFIFLLSDSGLVTGDFRNSLIGMIEDRMPFLCIIPPPWFTEQYPKFVHNLRINTGRLTTVYDVHETFVHLSNLINSTTADTDLPHDYLYHNVTTPSRYISSLFDEISRDRSCKSANVPDIHCPCNMVGLFPNFTTDSHLIGIARGVVKRINGIIKPYRKKCALINFKRLDGAIIIDPGAGNQNFSQTIGYDGINRYHSRYSNNFTRSAVNGSVLLVIKTGPSLAKFQAVVEYDAEKRKFGKVANDISRVDDHAQMSYCMLEDDIKSYCICIKR